jgi:hypothetical protein
MITNHPFFDNTKHRLANSRQKQPDGYSMISEIQAIEMDAWYLNEAGNIRSRQIPNEGGSHRLKIAMELVKSIKKTKGIAFDIDRNLSGIEIRSVGQVAKNFYNFNGTAPFPVPVSHAVHPDILILDKVAKELFLQSYIFQSNPERLIVDTTIVEADLINSFCKQAFAKLSSKGATSQSAKFTADAEKNIRKLVRVFRHIRQQNLRTFCLRFDLSLPIAQGRPPVRESTFFNFANQFLDVLDAGLDMATPLALVGKFEFLPDIGQRLHVSAIWSVSCNFSSDVIRERIRETWSRISDSQGHCYFQAFNAPNYRAWGMGFDQLPPLELALTHLFRRDNLLRFVPQRTLSTIVFCELSKPAQQVLFRV